MNTIDGKNYMGNRKFYSCSSKSPIYITDIIKEIEKLKDCEKYK